ncbi:RNA-binding domain-containing protein [Flavobacterium sp. XS2P14]|uniref:RNA-binding domain-containing protein n=1 Tax=Flavobacterium sp. XS2P14 TaxID=3401735 RepID=UPI003AAF191D
MTKSELISKLGDLEWEDFEVKEAKAEVPKSSWETVSAFANSSGGWLVFGVKQSGKTFEIQGVTNPEKIEQDFLNTIRGDKFNVPIPSKQAKYTIDEKTILAFYIPVSNKKPVYYNTQANTYIRRGSSDQKATKEEIDVLYRDQTFGTKTSEIAQGTSRSDLNESSLKRYRDYLSRFNPEVSYNRYEEEEFLTKLRIIENGQCTLGGLLVLGNRDTIERFFPDFRIDLLEIPGTSYRDATVRYTFRLDEYENLWEYYFECMARLKSKVDVEFTMMEDGFAKDVSPSLDALREALVNMLMHADHFSPACPRIRIFTDHIEFYNPGGLPKPLEELKGKDISLPRNPIITKLFRVVKLAENAGFGLDKIEYNWNKYNNTLPTFDVTFDSVIVNFDLAKLIEISQSEQVDSDHKLGESTEKVRRKYGESMEKVREKYGDKLADTPLKIVLAITNDPNINVEQLATQLQLSTSAVEKQLAKLKKEGLLIRHGTKGGFWEILKS